MFTAAILNPAEGLMIYVTEPGDAPFGTKGWYGYKDAWQLIA
jgi:hypothetical protein